MDDLISRQDAIDALMEILDRPNHAEFLYTDEICRALNHLPSAQPKHTKTHACDCISRQAAIAFVDCGYLRPPTELAWSDKDVVDMLKRLPSAQPEVIHCKDCENLQTDWKPQDSDGYYCAIMDRVMGEDDFCSLGERKTDG